MRPSLLRTSAVLAAVGISVVTFGTAGAAAEPGAATTTAPPTTAPAPTTTAAAPTTAAGSPTTAAAGPTTTAAGAATTAAVGPTTTAAGAATTVVSAAGVLPANATIEQIQTAVVGVFGPSTDVVGELIPFVASVPPGVPTPDASVVQEFNVFYYPDTEDPSFSYYSATQLLTTDVPAPELITLYQSALPAAGYVQIGDEVRNEDTRQIRVLTYEMGQPTSDQDELTVIIVDETSSTQTDYVQLEIDYGLDPAVVQMYSGWPAGMPLIEGLPVEGADLTTSNFGGDITLRLSNRYSVPIAYTEAFPQFEAGLASTSYTIDPESDPTEGYFDLVGGELQDVTVFMSEGFPEGTTNLSIDTSFDIVA